MTMQHKRGTFGEVAAIEIRPYCDYKQDKAIRERRIAVTHLAMASRRITADYPELAGWFCLQVRGRSEKIIAEELQAVDIESLVPTRLGERIVKRHRIIKGPLLPVLPGYVLVRCVPSPAAMAGLCRFDRRVVGVVGGAETPYRIPLKYVEKFIKKAEAGEYDYRPPSPLRYELGERVRVHDGPFASFPAIVTAIDAERNRISVDINIFGRMTPVELDVAQVEKV